MVLFDPRSSLDLPRFGIQIPTLDSRKTRTLAALKSHPALKEHIRRWLADGYDDVLNLTDLQRAHCADYAAGFFDRRAESRLIQGFELIGEDGRRNRWNPDEAISPLTDMVPPLMKFLAGTYRACRIALDAGFCHYLGGGAHHGHWDFGHGFCPLNDTALALRRLFAEERIRGAWVIDLDAHKGDGTAAIFHDDPRVKTLSIHMARGWPLDDSFPAGHPVYMPSDIDVPIESGEEPAYLERLETALQSLKNLGPADIAVVLAGADPWENDALPSTALLKLTRGQLNERDRMAYTFLESAGVPSGWLTAGGYGEDAWQIHGDFLAWALVRRYVTTISE